VKNHTLGFIHSVWTDAVEPFVRSSWLFMAYGCIGAWQGQVPDKTFYRSIQLHSVSRKWPMKCIKAFDYLAASNVYLDKCLGANTNGMPRGTIIESWSNPFLPYYLKNTNEHADDFRNARK
jgi:hexosaminidase